MNPDASRPPASAAPPLGRVRRRTRRRRRLLGAVAFATALPLVGLLVFNLAVAYWPYPRGLDHPPPASTLFCDRNGVELAAVVGWDENWHFPLADDQISPYLVQAIVAVEDRRFYEHHGVDWRAVGAALWEDAVSMRIRRGASTLSMQLQRLREPRSRSLVAKFEQAVRAAQIEKRLSKRQIVNEYLNRAPFGGNLVGAGAASWRYFGVPCRDLTLSQAALLAGLPQQPTRLRPDRHPQAARARRDHVLRCMRECGSISPEQLEAALAEPVAATWRPLPQHQARGSNADGALPALLRIGHASTSMGLRTTLDADLQRQASISARRLLGRLAATVDSVCIVVLDTPTGQCRAVVSASRLAGNVDLSSRRRSTGSVLKPFIYAAAFDDGACFPGEVLSDMPAAWPGYMPANYDHRYAGRMTAGDALAQSRNIPALHVLERAGLQRTVSLMRSLGIAGISLNQRDYGLTLAIGGAEASPMEIARAYAALGRGGDVRPVAWLQRPRRPASGRRVLSASTCRSVIDALSGFQRTAALSPQAAAFDTAWKTGTSSGHRDAWCAAVNGRYTVVVWAGNATGAGSTELVGADAAAPAALDLIASLGAPQSLSVQSLPMPTADRASPPQRVAPPPRMVIASPASDEQVVCNSDLPLSQQNVMLRALLMNRPGAASEPSAAIWWFIDGHCLGQFPSDRPVPWAPTPGIHEVRAVAAAGCADVVRFVVRDGHAHASD